MIEAPNTFNINGVYIPREVASASIFDINRIEVLPGPGSVFLEAPRTYGIRFSTNFGSK